MTEYQELAKIAQRYYNDRGFCSVIALAVASGRKFGKCRAAFARQGRKHRCGTYKHQQVLAAAELGLRVEPRAVLTAETQGRHLQNVTRWLPNTGTFWVYTRSHVTCVKDGVIEDWAHPDNGGSKKRITEVFEILPAHN